MIPDFTAWDWACILLAWLLLAAVCAPLMGRAIATPDDDIRQPADRSWFCSDNAWRSESEAADFCAVTPGSWVRYVPAEDDAEWLPEWINDHDEPLYVPREWVS